ncbi:MAG: hypothetical protein QG556_856 [Pseudomonadota bacterium]|nr:hypothetical protein [Pseudomonadota bacterium]
MINHPIGWFFFHYQYMRLNRMVLCKLAEMFMNGCSNLEKNKFSLDQFIIF